MSEVISSGKIVQKPEVVIDNSFFLPPSVVDMRERGETDTKNRTDEDGLADIDDSFEATVPDETEDDKLDPTIESPVNLQAPGWVSVVSQEVRFAPDGNQVVDVILEVEDISGVSQFDVRVTKA